MNFNVVIVWMIIKMIIQVYWVVFETFRIQVNLNFIWKYCWNWSTNIYRSLKASFGPTGLPVTLQRSLKQIHTRPDYRLGWRKITPDYQSLQRTTGNTPEDSRNIFEEHRTTGVLNRTTDTCPENSLKTFCTHRTTGDVDQTDRKSVV